MCVSERTCAFGESLYRGGGSVMCLSRWGWRRSCRATPYKWRLEIVCLSVCKSIGKREMEERRESVCVSERKVKKERERERMSERERERERERCIRDIRCGHSANGSLLANGREISRELLQRVSE